VAHDAIDSVRRPSVRLIFGLLRTPTTSPLPLPPEPSARPAGSSRKNLQRFPVCPEGALENPILQRGGPEPARRGRAGRHPARPLTGEHLPRRPLDRPAHFDPKPPSSGFVTRSPHRRGPDPRTEHRGSTCTHGDPVLHQKASPRFVWDDRNRIRLPGVVVHWRRSRQRLGGLIKRPTCRPDR
jgi:hypothetical protein